MRSEPDHKSTETPKILIEADSGSVSVADLQRQITPEWLSTALAERYPGVAVESASFGRIVAGCSVKLWMDLKYNEAGRLAELPAVMVVKAGFARHSPIMLFTYESEMSAYRDVLPRFPINAPQCFYAGKSPDGQSAAIIIEDLTPRRPTFCHALRPLNYEQARSFVTALAVFHSRTWNHPCLADGSFGWARWQATTRAGLAAYFSSLVEPKTWAQYMALPRGCAVSKMFHDRDRFLEAFGRLEGRSAQQPQVILMGDSHLGNLYLEEDGTPGFLDFQCRIASWSQEVAYFIGAALDMVDRRAWERDLLEAYLDTLARRGVRAPAFADAWQSYREHLLFGLFVWLTNGVEFQTESVNTANAARLGHAAIENDTWQLLN